MTVSVHTVDRARLPSVYFSRAYGEASARHFGGEWLNIADEGGHWQVPLVVRDIGHEFSDAVSPYGYAGIYVDRSALSVREINRAWADTKAILGELNIVSVFLRFSPFLDSTRFGADELSGLDVDHVSDTILVPVNTSEVMWAQLKGGARTTIRKARTGGLHGEVQEAPESIASNTHPFRRLYTATMDRLHAAQQYYFGDSYYEQLRSQLPSRLHVASVRDDAGCVVAAALLLSDTGTVHYHLSGSDAKAARYGANNLLIWTILDWCAGEGYSDLHLGGGLKPDDGLFQFKQSFGGRRAQFRVGRMVVDHPHYDELVAVRARELACEPRQVLSAGFFPAYRAGAVRGS